MTESLPVSRESALDELLAREAIRDILSGYCHAIDRCDADLLRSLYWPDGFDDHGLFVGNAMDYVDFVIPRVRQMGRTLHHSFNPRFQFLDADRAKVESYCMAYHELDGQEVEVGSRFFDEFERRSGEWRLLERVSIIDWNEMRPAASDWSEDNMFKSLRAGGHLPDDPSIEWRAKSFGTRLAA